MRNLIKEVEQLVENGEKQIEKIDKILSEKHCECCEIVLTEENTSENALRYRCNDCYDEFGDMWADQ